jgi:NADH:ubiquinone oxidoreductase subunit F (NADH-binding)
VASDFEGVDAQMVVWEDEVTAGAFGDSGSHSVNAAEIFTSNYYTWKVIAVDEKQSIVDMATNIAKFYEFESCGKCTPCREGTMRILGLLENISMKDANMKDLDTLQELAEVIKETSFCGLGQTATSHLLTAMKHFRKEFEERVREKKTRRRIAR